MILAHSQVTDELGVGQAIVIPYVLTTVTSLMYCFEVWITSLNTTLHTASTGRNDHKCLKYISIAKLQHNIISIDLLQHIDILLHMQCIVCIALIASCGLLLLECDFLSRGEHSERMVAQVATCYFSL